jgi:uncharacterized protein (TIGR00369 family)
VSEPTETLSEQEQQRRRAMVAEHMPQTPFISLLGLQVERFEPDDVAMRLPFREELTNEGVYYHGGAIAGALDTCGALAAWSNHDFAKGARASTVGLSIQYVGACKRSDLVCRATTTRRGKELIFVDIVGEDEAGNPVAHAILTYRIVP